MAIVSGEVKYNALYLVSVNSITYNTVVVTAGNTFRGVLGVATFSGSGVVDEVSEFLGGDVELVATGEDAVFPADLTKIQGMAVEFVINDAEKTVTEVTKIQGMAVELIDNPAYSFAITETRL
jgi:hypothetical protein